MTKEPWRTHAPGLLARESQVQQQLAATDIPAPATIAVDPQGEGAGTPAHLMSRLPGAVELGRHDDVLLERLARLLAGIHAFDPAPARPRQYQSWAPPSKRVVPGWARCPDLWREAFDLLDQPPPSYVGTFLHRDFHVGNVLWMDGDVSGVVDWVETSWGPRALDVAHCTTYLAMLHGQEAAGRFETAYRRLTDDHDDDRARYWRVMDVVGYLPDPTKVAQPWRDLGHEVTDEQARARLEQHLAAVLER
jgi:aminoglycoside phosphotransferase (APT) family kinase protein